MDEVKVEVPAKFKDIVENIEKMSVLDLNELVKLFEKKFGVSAAAVAVAAPAGAAAPAGEEKSAFNVELTDGGAQKIAVIKVVKELGMAANGAHANLKIVEIPGDVDWTIQEYDGVEWVAEKHRTWT